MRFLQFVILSVGVTAFAGGPAHGQFFLAELGRGSGPSQLLLREEVQQELKMTEEQIKKAKLLSQEIREGLDKDFADLSERVGREEARGKQALGNEIKKRAREYVKRVITPEQHKRLDEIALRAAGVQGFREEQVQQALGLTAKQKEDIQQLMQQTILEMQLLIKSTPDEYEQTQKRAAEMRKACYEKALTYLTPEQRDKWHEMRGKPFVFKIVDKPPINPVALMGEIPLPPEAHPTADRNYLDWVDIRAEKWQPYKAEKRFNDIGWADADILKGLEIARKHQRPLFVFLVDGFSHRGRC